MASGKKGKKNKGKTLALTDFLQETTGTLPTQPIRKSSTNWADEVEDYDGFESRSKVVNVVLPTAPKASRDYDDISEKVPKEPPFMAYLSNLPYDVDENEIAQFFKNMRIANMRIPKDDRPGETPRLKGFGYVEFEDRESLLNALVIPDTMLKSRRIRIEVAANAENDRRRGRMDMGRDRGGDRSESFGDWRSGPRSEVESDNRRGFNRDNMRDGGFSRDRDSGFNRGDRDSGFTRGDRDSGFTRGDRDGGFNRSDRDGGFRSNRDQDEKPGGWRDGERPNRDSERDRGFSRSNYRDSDRGGRFDDRDDRRGGFGRRFEDRDNERNGGFTRSDRDSEPASSEPRRRQKLQLAPRTKPIEDSTIARVEPAVPSASIFGSAKPVDTSQRERQIEEKLQKEQIGRETRDGSKDRKEWGGRDGSRDSRPLRDNSRDRKPRDGSRDRKLPSDGSRDRKSNRDGSRDRRGPRDNSIDKKEKFSRDSSKERKERLEVGERRNTDRGRGPQRISDKDSPNRDGPVTRDNRRNEDERRGPPKSEHKSPDNRYKNEKPKKEEKRDRHEKELPKFQEPEPPNFAANNKYAFLQTDENSD